MIKSYIQRGASGPTELSNRWLYAAITTLALLAGLGCAPDQEIALRRLREVGQSVCDADTFEAKGYWILENSPEPPMPICYLFGPNGEYHISAGNMTIIHDTKHLACSVPDEDYVGIVETGAYQSRQEPHNRWPGDLIMAAAMGLRGKGDLVLPYMRLCGANWLQEWHGVPNVTSIIHENVGGRACTRYDLRNAIGSLQMWVDNEQSILSKYIINVGSQRLSIMYETVKMNHDIPPEEFHIPDWMFKKSQAELNVEGNGNKK